MLVVINEVCNCISIKYNAFVLIELQFINHIRKTRILASDLKPTSLHNKVTQ